MVTMQLFVLLQNQARPFHILPCADPLTQPTASHAVRRLAQGLLLVLLLTAALPFPVLPPAAPGLPALELQ
jgi:hypothetical protein